MFCRDESTPSIIRRHESTSPWLTRCDATRHGVMAFNPRRLFRRRRRARSRQIFCRPSVVRLPTGKTLTVTTPPSAVSSLTPAHPHRPWVKYSCPAPCDSENRALRERTRVKHKCHTLEMKQKLFRFAALSTIYIRYIERQQSSRTARRAVVVGRDYPRRINKIDLFIYGACGPGADARLNQVLITKYV